MHFHGLLSIVALLIRFHSRLVNKRQVFPQICVTTADCEGLNQVCVETIGLSDYGHCTSKTESPFVSDMEDHNQDYSFLKLDLKETDGSGERVITDNLDEPPTKRKRDTEGIEHDTDDSGSSRHRIPFIDISGGRMKRYVSFIEEKFKIILLVLHFDKRKNSEGKKTLTSLGKQFKQFLSFVDVNNVQKTKVAPDHDILPANHHFKTHLKKRDTLDSDLKDNNDTIEDNWKDNDIIDNDDDVLEDDRKKDNDDDMNELKAINAIENEKDDDGGHHDKEGGEDESDHYIDEDDGAYKVKSINDNSNEMNRTVRNAKENINKTVNKDERHMNKTVNIKEHINKTVYNIKEKEYTENEELKMLLDEEEELAAQLGDDGINDENLKVLLKHNRYKNNTTEQVEVVDINGKKYNSLLGGNAWEFINVLKH